jgi:hypothetical protein
MPFSRLPACWCITYWRPMRRNQTDHGAQLEIPVGRRITLTFTGALLPS